MIRCFVLISLLAGFEASVLSQISVVPGVQQVTPPSLASGTPLWSLRPKAS